MTKDELIAKQQMEIENLKLHLSRFKDARDRIIKYMVCIGGPLNDNKLMYTNEQKQIFFRISSQIDYL